MTDSAALAGLSGIASRYSIILCDIWGVLHNGLRAHKSAVNALTSYRRQGGYVGLVTNAPRPNGPIVEMLDRLKVSRDAYDVIVSSGDVTKALIAAHTGKTVHVVGPDHDLSLFDGIDVVHGAPEDSTAVVVTDLDDDSTETPQDYHDRMSLWLKRGLPMICANPDKVVEVGGRMVYCGGALAELYEQRGGTVLMAGKPFAPIYVEALKLLREKGATDVDRSRILAIGDAVRTDAMGAADQDLDFLFITGSVHGAEIRAAGENADALVTELVKPSGARMVGHMEQLAW